MNTIISFTLKSLKKLYQQLNKQDNLNPKCENNPDKVSQSIYDKLMSDQSCMIARFGSTELNAITNYRGIKQYKNHYIDFIKGKSPQWWWNEKGLEEIFTCSGFFPPTSQW